MSQRILTENRVHEMEIRTPLFWARFVAGFVVAVIAVVVCSQALGVAW